MAVEKMKLFNIVGRLNYIDQFLEDIIEIDEIDQVDTFTEVQKREFSVKASEDNIEIIEDFNDISPFEKPKDGFEDRLKSLIDNLNIDDSNNERKIIDKETVENLYSKVSENIDQRTELLKRKEELEKYIRNYQLVRDENIDLQTIDKMKYFGYRIGEVSKDGRYILRNNYENIPSFILHLDKKDTDFNKKYINEIKSIDDSTIDLRENTDDILNKEKEHVRDVSLKLDNKYDELMKNKGKQIYDDIMDQAEKQKEDISNQYKNIKEETKIAFSKNKDNILKEFKDKIINNR